MLVSLLFGMIDALKGSGLGEYLPDAVARLPLSEQGLAWLIPSLATLFVAFIVDRVLAKRSEALA
jgi:LIVCS family branched-chain amino acid:cation transporter